MHSIISAHHKTAKLLEIHNPAFLGDIALYIYTERLTFGAL